jgi:hypothetical protein
MGLNGICIAAFNGAEIQKAFALDAKPLLILAIGRSAENIELVDISETESHAYYRKDGVHYVPKVRLEELIIK